MYSANEILFVFFTPTIVLLIIIFFYIHFYEKRLKHMKKKLEELGHGAIIDNNFYYNDELESKGLTRKAKE